MNTLYISLLCILLYALAFGLKVKSSLSPKKETPSLPINVLIATGLSVHAVLLYLHIMNHPQYVNLSIFNTSSLISWFILIITQLTSMRNAAIDKALLFILPVCILSVSCNELLVDIHHYRPRAMFSPGLLAHIILSIFAYSTLTITCVQAVILFLQEENLKNKRHTRISSWLPPIETTERILFNLLTFGLLLLSIAMATGAFFIENIIAQKMSHKLVFTLFSWLIFTLLLAGRHFRGWRGITAIKWTLAGFTALMLAYFGSKFALEIVLNDASTMSFQSNAV
ncbi:MAG: cytochrome c biogenesis protein CcsA [Pseudomonadota bacterium]